MATTATTCVLLKHPEQWEKGPEASLPCPSRSPCALGSTLGGLSDLPLLTPLRCHDLDRGDPPGPAPAPSVPSGGRYTRTHQ